MKGVRGMLCALILGMSLVPGTAHQKCQKNLVTLLDLCVSSLRRGHANLLCIVPILTDDPRRESGRRAAAACYSRAAAPHMRAPSWQNGRRGRVVARRPACTVCARPGAWRTLACAASLGGGVSAAHTHAVGVRVAGWLCMECGIKKLFTLLDLCVSSLRRGHANLLCIVPILTDDPRRESKHRCARDRK